jgi:hypothetical protein
LTVQEQLPPLPAAVHAEVGDAHSATGATTDFGSIVPYLTVRGDPNSMQQHET